MFRSLFGFRSSASQAPRTAQRPPRRKLAVEQLEDRRLLAVLLVGQNDPNAPFKTIGAAVAQATIDNANDTINVENGNYVEQVTIKTSLTLETAPGNTQVFISAPAALAPNFGASDLTNAIVAIGGGAGVTVDVHGFKIQGPVAASPLSTPPAAQTIDAGVYIAGGATGNIHDNTIQNVANSPLNPSAQTGDGVRVGRQSTNTVGHGTINNNIITGYQKDGISVENGSDATVTNNTVTGVGPTTVLGQNGITITSGATATVSTNTVSGNEFQGNTSVTGGADPTTNAQAGGIVLNDAGAGTTVSGNIIDANDVGIYSFNRAALASGNTPATLVTISGNNLGFTTANRYEGAVLEQGNTLFTGNTVLGGNVGVDVISFTGSTADSVATLQANGISGAVTGVKVANDTTGGGTTHNPNLTINASTLTQNQIFNNSVGLEVDAGTVSVSQSAIQNNTTAGILVKGGNLTSVNQAFVTGNAIGIDVEGGTVGKIFDNNLSSTSSTITNNSANLVNACGNFFGAGAVTPGTVGPTLSGSNVAGINTLGFFTFGSDTLPNAGFQADQPERWIDAVYQDLLGHCPDFPGQQNWLNLLGGPTMTNPTLTYAQVAADIASSVEYRGDLIIQYYERFLGRAPSQQEINTQVPLFTTQSVQQVESGILGSAEFLGLAGGTNSGYITRLFAVLFNHAGAQSLAAALPVPGSPGDATARAQIAFTVINNFGQPVSGPAPGEYYGLLVNNPTVMVPQINNVMGGIPLGYYEMFLHRVGAQSDVNGYINQLVLGSQNGLPTMQIPGIIGQFLGGPEFINNQTL